jgi:hypothetical protein
MKTIYNKFNENGNVDEFIAEMKKNKKIQEDLAD